MPVKEVRTSGHNITADKAKKNYKKAADDYFDIIMDNIYDKITEQSENNDHCIFDLGLFNVNLVEKITQKLIADGYTISNGLLSWLLVIHW